MNKVELVGRITKAVELKHTLNGTSIVRFTIACNRQKKDDGADFINCVAYAKIAELMDQYVKKGDRLGLIGRIQTGSYERNGSTIYTTDIIAENIEFMEPRQRQDDKPIDISDEDIPF